ncbi:MAG: hypothetical protein OXI96_06185 [Acidimicrobiaceae bacterium]|nr:hypothetical protein [Acidimicrobiaceae bacterium]
MKYGLDDEGESEYPDYYEWRPLDLLFSGEHNVLQYWHTDTGEITEVRLGPLLGCELQIVPFGSAVVVYDSSGMLDPSPFFGFVQYGVPWGDEAYPLVRGVGVGSGMDSDERSVQQSFLLGKLAVSSVGELLRVSTPQQDAYYDTYVNARIGLMLADAPHISELEPENDGESWFWPSADVIGTDGFYYGVGEIYNEPAWCPGAYGFVVAGDTGEVVACGSFRGLDSVGLGGVAFVLPEGSPGFVDSFAVPQGVPPGGCKNLDLETLRVPQTAGVDVTR